MSSNGNWIKLRRDVMEHVRDGRLSIQAGYAYILLNTRADKETGSGDINAAILRSWMPGLSEKTSQRILKSLADKHFIFRVVIPRSPYPYRYWVHGYEVTDGVRKGSQTSIAQAIKTNDFNDIQYLEHVPDLSQMVSKTAALGAEDCRSHGVLVQEGRRQDVSRIQDQPSTSRTDAFDDASSKACKGALIDSSNDASKTPMRDRRDAINDAINDASNGSTMAPDAGMLWFGEWLDSKTSGRLSDRAVVERLARVGLKQKPHGTIMEHVEISTGAPVNWPEALRRITGQPLPVQNAAKEVHANV